MLSAGDARLDAEVVTEQVLRVPLPLDGAEPRERLLGEGLRRHPDAGVEAEVHAGEVGVEPLPLAVELLGAGSDGSHREVGRAVRIRGGVGGDIRYSAAHG